MKRKEIFLIAIFLVACFQLCLGQYHHNSDSLIAALKNTKEDTNSTRILNQLASAYTFSDPQRSFEYSSKALLLSQKINSKKYIVESYQNLSTYYGNTGDAKTSSEYTWKSIPIIEELGNKLYLCDAYGNLSMSAYFMDDYAGAFNYSRKALQLAYEINDSLRIGIWLNTVGLNYKDITANYDTALSYLLKALKIDQQTNIRENISYDLYNIGLIYFLEQNSDKAFEYLNLALDMATKINDQQRMGESFSAIGDIYFAKKDFQKAEEYYKMALDISTKTNFFNVAIEANKGLAKAHAEAGKFDKAIEFLNNAIQVTKQSGEKYAMGPIYCVFSDVYAKAQKYETANGYLLKALAIGSDIGRKDLLKDVYQKLADNNKRTKNFEAAYNYQNMFIQMNDAIIGEQMLKKTAELQVQYEAEKKDKEILSLGKTRELKDAELKKQRLFKNALIGGLILFITLSAFVFINFRTRSKLRLQSIRNKIASDLHDDIGSTLNSISVYSEVAKQKSPTVVQELEQIGDASRKIIDAMSDIVWTINPKNDSFENIILRMRSISYNLLKAKNIEHSFRADEDLNNMKLSMEERRNFFLIFKEAVNNLLKYAEATRVSIALTYENNLIKLSVRDNGKGFNIKQFSTGNGLLNMKSRAEEMNAIFKIESEPGSGTNVELTLKT